MFSSIGRPICSIKLSLVRNVASRAAYQQQEPNENFGSLSSSGRKKLEIIASQNTLPDDADGYDRQVFDIKPRKNHFYYKWAISNHARQGRNGLKRALELFQEMKSEARIEPTFGNFTALIFGCAKARQTKTAFDLYEEGLKYFRKPSPAMVTCLINACAESSFPEYGLKRLDWFRTHLKVNYSIEMSAIHYRCMMKAYGKLGKIDLAADVFKEMLEAGIQPSTDAFNMLMIGCASQDETGTLLALRLYKRMRMYGIKPNSITYNNFLRCVHYCGMGSPELIQQTLTELPALTSFEQRLAYKAFKNKRPVSKASEEFEWLPSIQDLSSSVKVATSVRVPADQKGHLKLIEGGKSQSKEIRPNYDVNEIALMPSFLNCDSLPNLLSDDHLSLMRRIEAVQLDKLNNRRARFQLFGGLEGFIDMMKRDGCEPDIRIFNRLCVLVQPDRSGLLPLFHLIKEYPVIRDEQLYNTLIDVASSNYRDRRRSDLALTFLEEMHRDGLRPSVTTFESLAPTCDTLPQALNIVNDIERCGFVVSDKLLEKLFSRASSRKDFRYLIGMIELCQNKFNNFLPTKELLESLEATKVVCNNILVQYEKGKVSLGPGTRWLTESNIAIFDDFKQSLGTWLKSVGIQEEEHPWQQFDVKVESKRRGFVNYVNEFRALERVKRDALEKGERFGNLYAKVRDYKERQKKESNQENA